METKKKRSFVYIGAAAGVIIAALLLIGIMWMGRTAGRDSENAVREVSLLFLKELAGRREQVVSTALATHISDMKTALNLMTKEDLKDEEHLQAYQKRIKELYGLEQFAFVDTNGLIYTSMGTRKDIKAYSFDYQNLTQAEISVKSLDMEDKKVVIAMPVDHLPLEGEELVVCFMEIDMDAFWEGISFTVDDSGSTLCNMYTSAGISLTGEVLGGLADELRILDAMKHSQFDPGFSYDQFEKEYKGRKEGYVSFTYDGVRETLYYVPVKGTDWMLTYLVKDSVISKEIGSVSQGIILRSVLMTALIALVLVVVGILAIRVTKHNAKVTLEREKEETKNRVRQEELEEQLALQEELLDQEKQRAQQDQMITALSSDYRSVYYVDMDRDVCICYRNDPTFDDGISVGTKIKYLDAFRDYANRYVAEGFREEFLAFIEPEAIRMALEKQELIGIRYLINRDGEERYEMLRIAGVRHIRDRDDGKVHAIGVGFSNIDEEMRESLAKNQALSEALAAAEEASKAKTVFLSSMSHEIRTPMNAIIGLDNLALNVPDLPEQSREYLEQIGRSAQHLLGLINDILDMSRIESGRMVIKNEEFAFAELVEQVNTIIGGQCRDKGLNYSCRLESETDDFYIGDSMKLRQVLINILGNAVKFTPEGGSVDFIVKRTASYKDKSTMRFIISDTGIGMSKEYLPKIFETFSQEDEKAANKLGSTGLGMAITKNIVEMMNGKIKVESEQGKGTTFTVTVTLFNSSRRLSDAAEAVEINPQELSVLVVDDDEVACEHAKLVLGKLGINAEFASSGAEALEMVKVRHARQEPYNFLLMDYKMEEMDGVETTRRVREEIGDESSVIMLTAYNWDDILVDAKNAGVDTFLAKPLFSERLMDELKKALLRKQKEEAKEKPKAKLEGRRVLLAEDMMVNAQIMIEVLKMRQIEADHAENGRIAVEKYMEHEAGYYDAILMDMRMPELNGLEATEAIRAAEDHGDAKTIPIIALTANAFDEDVQRSMQAGLDAHLSKPVDADMLFETLENMMGRNEHDDQ